MNTEASATANDVLNVLLEVVELLIELAEAIHEKHNLAHKLRVNIEARRATHRFEIGKVTLMQQIFACLHRRLHLFHRAAHGFALLTRRDARDVREFLDGHKTRAKKIHAIHDRFGRGVRESERRGNRAEHRGFTRTRRTHDEHVTAGAREVEVELALPLAGRIIEQADRHRKEFVLRKAQPATGCHGLACDLIKRDDGVDRVEPNGARDSRLLFKLTHDGREDRGALFVLVVGTAGSGLCFGARFGIENRELVDQGHVREVLDLHLILVRWQKPRNITRTELRVGRRINLEVAVAGKGRERERIDRVDHGSRLGRRQGTKTNAVRKVGFETAKLAALDSLARQKQVHADRTADTAD